MNMDCTRFSSDKRAGFTLIELLVVISIISILMAILVPTLVRARGQAKSIVCISNIKQLGLAFLCYGNDNDGYTIPLHETSTDTYWWGKKHSDGINHTKGFVWPYLQSKLEERSVYECPSQPYGSYNLQGKPPGAIDEPKWITSTYGYNGYYLSPPKSGWFALRQRPWPKIATISKASDVIVFADTLINYSAAEGNPNVWNTALLDPPYILSSNGTYWQKNTCPTTCFRHNDKANAVFVDGHCKTITPEGAKYISEKAKIGSVGGKNSPHYVPDYQQWVQSEGRRRR